MGYDLHITRRKSWIDTGADISKDEFVSLVLKDPEFTYPGQNGADDADWKSSKTGHESWLCWDSGSIYTKNPKPELIDKMVVIAKVLEAKVQGDDGEVYFSSTDIR